MGPEDDKGENHTAGIPNKIPNFSTITARPPSLLKKQSSFLFFYIYRKLIQNTYTEKYTLKKENRPKRTAFLTDDQVRLVQRITQFLSLTKCLVGSRLCHIVNRSTGNSQDSQTGSQSSQPSPTYFTEDGQESQTD